jgi:hypothetical protein
MRFYDNKLNKIESNYVPKNIPWEFLYKTFEKEQAGIDKVKVEAEAAKDLFNINPGEHFDKAGVDKVLAPYREQYDALTNDIRSGNYSAAENAAKLTGFVSKYKADKKVNALKQAEGEYVKYTQDRLDPKKNQEYNRAMNSVFYKGEIQNLIDPSTASESDINNAYRFRIAPTTDNAFKEPYSYLKPESHETTNQLINNGTVKIRNVRGKDMLINTATNNVNTQLTYNMVYDQLLERGKQLALDPNQDELYGFRVEEYARNGWGEYTPEMYAKEGAKNYTGEINNTSDTTKQSSLGEVGSTNNNIPYDQSQVPVNIPVTIIKPGAVKGLTGNPNVATNATEKGFWENLEEGEAIGAVWNYLFSDEPGKQDIAHNNQYKELKRVATDFFKQTQNIDLTKLNEKDTHNKLKEYFEKFYDNIHPQHFNTYNVAGMYDLSNPFWYDAAGHPTYDKKQYDLNSTIINKAIKENNQDWIIVNAQNPYGKPMSIAEFKESNPKVLDLGVNLSGGKQPGTNYLDKSMIGGYLINSKAEEGKEDAPYYVIKPKTQPVPETQAALNSFYKFALNPVTKLNYSNNTFPVGQAIKDEAGNMIGIHTTHQQPVKGVQAREYRNGQEILIFNGTVIGDDGNTYKFSTTGFNIDQLSTNVGVKAYDILLNNNALQK